MVKRRRVFGMRASMVYKCMKLTAVLCGYWTLGLVGLGWVLEKGMYMCMRSVGG